MSDDDCTAGSGSGAAAGPEEEASRLKALAEETYTSGDLKAAAKLAKQAHELHPSLDGLAEMLNAFEILRTAAAPISGSGLAEGGNSVLDYYEILGVEQFSHINTIKKQYKKLAMALHPDKNPSAASAEAFKLVGEAARVLSDRIRRKEYDTRLRVALQVKATQAVGLTADGTAETFKTACSTCRLLHQFERKYLGHNLMCPSCKKTFKAMEVERDSNNGGDSGKNGSVTEVQTRASARIRERVAKGDHMGIVERCGLGMKRRRNDRVGEVAGKSGVKVANAVRSMDKDDYLLKDLVAKRVKKAVKEGEDDGSDGGGDKGLRSEEDGGEKQGNRVGDGNRSMRSVGVEEVAESSEVEIVESEREAVVGNESNRMGRVGVKEVEGGEVDIMESDRAKRAKMREEGTMTLSQIRMLAKKKFGEGKVAMRGKEVDIKKLKQRKREDGLEVIRESDDEEVEEEEFESEKKRKEESERENEEEVERDEENENEKEKEKEVGSEKMREEANGKGKEKESETLNEVERDNVLEREKEFETQNGKRRGGANKNQVNGKVMEKKRGMLKEVDRDVNYEKEKKREQESDETGIVKEMEYTREKRVRRRVSKYGNLEASQTKSSNHSMAKEIGRHITRKNSNVEIMPVEDSDFHDFDMDRTARSFKKGQVWAVYDDNDGMPRHYVLIDEIVTMNPFEVTLSWLQVHGNGQGESRSQPKVGLHDSCGSFRISNKVSVKYLNLFSHVVHCERAARAVYRIYPKKGSIWAMYNDSVPDAEESNAVVMDKQSYNIIVCLSSFSDVHGLSIARLEKVPGFRTVFKRSAVGANAVTCFGKGDVMQFSHQIPAKKLTGDKKPAGLPRDCWELDPASLPREFLSES